MNKFKLVGLGIAFVLLITALATKLSGGAQAVSIMLPILTLGLWVLTTVDIISYKKYSSGEKAIRGVELARIISLAVISVLLTVAVVISLIG